MPGQKDALARRSDSD